MAKKVKHQAKQKEAMELVDIYWVPAEIAEHFKLLREHCAQEVEKLFLEKYASVKRVTIDEEVGQVVAAYDAAANLQDSISLSPISISKLEKEISADRLEKYLFENKGKARN